MQVAWEALLAQTQANRGQAYANRVTADALLGAMPMRGAQGCCEMPCQDDELQARFHDAHVVTATAKTSVDGYGNAVGETEIMEVPGFGDVILGAASCSVEVQRRWGLGSNQE